MNDLSNADKDKNPDSVLLFLQHASNVFKNFAIELLASKEITSYSLKDDDGVRLTVTNNAHEEIAIDITPSSEVFSRLFANTYESINFAYDADDKEEELQNLLDEVKYFLDSNNYTEEVYKIGKKTVLRKLKHRNGSQESKANVFGGRLLRLFAREHA